ncbi:MAG: hypothetical protein KKE73_04925 [Proteobacteria bacterium]|nr:hypothetical protein [Pseudomonadota bacterium]
MNLVERYRLTKQLHDQVEHSGRSVETVLQSWSKKNYALLCEYVTQCTGVVPKYVLRLAELTGLSSKAVIMEIVGAQISMSGLSGADNPMHLDHSSGYLPEDSLEKDAFVKSLVQDQQRFM